MNRDFDEWNELKKDIHFWEAKNILIESGDIWYINIRLNIGSESIWKWKDYKRPVLVIKKLWNMFLCISMTTKWKEDNKFYYKINDKYFNKNSYLVLSQVKSIDKKRFIKRIWSISKIDLTIIKKELKLFLF